MKPKKTAPMMMALAAMLLSGCGGKGRKEQTPPAKPVRVAVARKMRFADSLTLQGTVESKRYALVPAQVGGVIDELLVAEGDAVTNGQALCRLDSEQLGYAVEARRRELEVARSALEVSRAQESRAAAVLGQTARDHQRLKKLASQKVVSVHEAEEAETAWKNARAAHRLAEAQVKLSGSRVGQAEAALDIAERELRDAVVRAPIDGRISRKFLEQGEMVESGHPVFRLDDPAVVDISVFAPADFYPRVKPGQTMMQVNANGVALGALPVVYRSPTIDERLRTFEVKARREAPPEGVVAGSLADVELIFETHEGLGVPTQSVLQRSGKACVFTVEADRARLHVVQTGLPTDDWVEIREGLSAGARVVTEGGNLLNDGDPVNEIGAR